MQDNPAISWKKFSIFLVLLGFSFIFINYLKSENIILDQDEYKVTNIFDGDTIEVEKDGQKYTVRYLGIDTPELHKANTPVQCFAEESYETNKRLVHGKIIRMMKDIEDKDKYGRLLRYIWVEDTFINKELIKSGNAYIYEYNLDKLKYSSDLKQAMKSAIDDQIGLWSQCDNDSRVPKFEKQYDYVSSITTSSIENSVLGVSDNSVIISSTSSSSTKYIASNSTVTSKSAANIIAKTSQNTAIETKVDTIIPTSASTQQNIVIVSESTKEINSTPLSKPECIGVPNIKGNVNISTGTMIYHMEGQRYYEKTQVKEEEGDRWFCTEDEAIAAGFRKSKQ